MSLYLKDPDAAIDYAIDWSAGYLVGQTIAGSSWAIVPVEAGGVAVSSHSFTDTTARATLTGGLPGHVYRATNRVILSDGRTDDRSLTLRVESR